MARENRGLRIAAAGSIGCGVLVIGCCFMSTLVGMCSGPAMRSAPPASPATPVSAPRSVQPVASAPVPTTATPTSEDDEESARREAFARARGRGSMEVRREDLGDEWPLTVERGTLRCEGAGSLGIVTFEAPDGTTYGVNGLGRSAPGVTEVEPIWALDPTPPMEGARISMGSLIALGLALCRP